MKYSFWVLSTLLCIGLISSTACNKEQLGEGMEGSGGEAGNESGIRWHIDSTASEVVNGLHLVLTYDAATSTFSGTLKNLNSSMVPMTRLEVHVFDAAGVSTEFGPTPGVDMLPGETRNVSLAITAGLNSVEFNMHPEFGAANTGG